MKKISIFLLFIFLSCSSGFTQETIDSYDTTVTVIKQYDSIAYPWMMFSETTYKKQTTSETSSKDGKIALSTKVVSQEKKYIISYSVGFAVVVILLLFLRRKLKKPKDINEKGKSEIFFLMVSGLCFSFASLFGMIFKESGCGCGSLAVVRDHFLMLKMMLTMFAPVPCSWILSLLFKKKDKDTTVETNIA